MRTAEERLAASLTIREYLTEDLKEARVSFVLLRAERDDALDKLKYARESIANIEAERDEALRKLAQANGHNDILRGQVEQLQAALKARKCGLSLLQWDKIVAEYGEAIAKDLAADLGLGSLDWRKTVAANLAAQQAIDDSAEPELAAAMMAERSLEIASALLRKEEEELPHYYCQKCGRRTPHRPTIDTPEFFCVECGGVHIERVAQGEPTTEKCPSCFGKGNIGWEDKTGAARTHKCPRCQGTGRVLVHADAPQHLDTAREGATDHAMSLDQDTD